ncbi:glycoside hydrolase family 95 protein [Polaribacter vadi]|uniref:glycoside hydrolase family 95 protein n=1 Tax=Polaribacter TaxID=52959 RepID=UPI001C0A2882|nr:MULTISPECIES: glycoside hydrolase family 95 protein [Polaribacter]MBU3011300.1 glycoside hydrolase family 95 protein [Polaribacter vadi]MDO6741113.1 glycoside hydrolase family 95 protein [Polaribacter sp. 1_MG-2023]
MIKRSTSFLRNLVLLASIVFLLASCVKKIEKDTANLKLWYQKPAKATPIILLGKPNKDNPEWLKALPLGNGSFGAMVFGDVNKERIQLNEETMWSGSVDDNDNPAALEAQAEIRKLLFEGKYKEATELTRQTQVCIGAGTGHGKGANVTFGCFQTLGDLWLDFEKENDYQNYQRELDLEDAVVRVQYSQDKVTYKREYFVSHPDQLMVVKLTADVPGSISFKSTLTRPELYQTKAAQDQLVMQGALSDGKGGKGLEYITRLSAKNKNGTVIYKDNYIEVKNADEVILYLTASTNYVLDYPNYKGRDHKTITTENLKKGKEKSYDEVLKEHTQDYQKYFNRVSLQLTTSLDTIPTDVRLKNFKKSTEKSDLHLVELLYQYGRYLLISSSRPGTMPANLQGIWANQLQTPWNGDYHTDVNVQMNYWLAEVANLGEMHLPLFDLMASLQEPGAKTAKVHYNAKGWVVHPVTNVWGFTSPGEKSDWGMHVGAGAWLTTHIMEHYYFTLDKEFLKKEFPVLKGATEFYMDWLIPDPKTGKLISGPTVSPENKFKAPDGSVSKICMAPAHDQQVIWQLFQNYIDAATTLNITDEFLEHVKQAQQQLQGPKIGTDGRLLEWNEEFEEIEKGHRHISHLYALHPGFQIDVDKTPEWATAAKKSLDYRIQHGGGATGWSSAWLINQYARLGDGDNAENSLKTLLSKRISYNLFGQHPPFQIDANFGATAGISEMLLQSHTGEIRLLPALPSDWKNGAVKGLCAKGGFVINIKWKDGKLTKAQIYSKNGGVANIKYKSKIINVNTLVGQNIDIQL